MRLTAVHLPIDWESFGLPRRLRAGGVVIARGERGWAWDGPAPDLGFRIVPVEEAEPVPGWGLDHVVALVPDLDDTKAAMARSGLEPRRRVIVRDRPTAFFLAGTLLEVIQEPTVDRPLLWGIALDTEEPLEEVAERWRTFGHDVSDPRPAYQQGRSIISVRDAGAGLAVMSQR